MNDLIAALQAEGFNIVKTGPHLKDPPSNDDDLPFKYITVSVNPDLVAVRRLANRLVHIGQNVMPDCEWAANAWYETNEGVLTFMLICTHDPSRRD